MKWWRGHLTRETWRRTSLSFRIPNSALPKTRSPRRDQLD